MKKTYILVTTAKRKNAKRHVVTKSCNIDYLRTLGRNNIADCYITEIYDGHWALVETIK